MNGVQVEKRSAQLELFAQRSIQKGRKPSNAAWRSDGYRRPEEKETSVERYARYQEEMLSGLEGYDS